MLNITHKIVFLLFCEFYITYYLFYTKRHSYSFFSQISLSVVCFYIFNFCFNVLDWFLLKWSSSEIQPTYGGAENSSNPFSIFQKQQQSNNANIPYFRFQTKQPQQQSPSTYNVLETNYNYEMTPSYAPTREDFIKKQPALLNPPQNTTSWIPQEHYEQEQHHHQFIPHSSLDEWEPSAPLLSKTITPVSTTSTPQNEYSDLDDVLNDRLALRRIRVPQDGDCLFSALKEDNESVFELRRHIVQFIQNNRYEQYGDLTKGMTLGDFITSDYAQDLDYILEQKLLPDGDEDMMDTQLNDVRDLSSRRRTYYWGNYTDIVAFVLMRHCQVELYYADRLWEHEALGNSNSQYRIVISPPNYTSNLKRILYISDNHYDKLIPL